MKWCLKCQGQNAEDAVACAWCGALMAPTSDAWKAIAKRWHEWKYVLALAAGLAVLAIYFVAERTKSSTPTFGSCLENGRRYFKEIGSWPRLSDGRDAEEVAGDRCRRRYEAFPE